MSRASHLSVDSDGCCTRCGCRPDGPNDWCPPGFWMTTTESMAWHASDNHARPALEEMWATQRHRAEPEKR